MIECQYVTIYNDRATGETRFDCQEEARASGLCIFHDLEYADHKDIEYNLQKKIDNARQHNTPLYFIGYTIPDISILPFYLDWYLTGSRILGGSLNMASLTRKDFTDVQFPDVFDFSDSKLTEIDFSYSRFSQVSFNEATIKNSSFSHCVMKSADFLGAKITTTDMNDSSFGKINFDWARIEEVRFHMSTFKKAIFSGGFIKNSQFAAAQFDDLDFIYTESDDISFTQGVIKHGNFQGADFRGEADFSVGFPAYKETQSGIPIKFDYATFRQRTRFIGSTEYPLELSGVSFKGVDLSEVEFHNVKWLRNKYPPWREMVIDEVLLEKNKNYEEVSKIYNQLRKNYESKLLFNEASNFFVGELDTIRKGLVNGNFFEKLSSFPYFAYKFIAFYGESFSLPLLLWTPVIILGFFLIRNNLGFCSLETECNVFGRFVDSVSAYFLMPRSNSLLDIIERVLSIPFLSTAFIALKRKFERRK